MILFTNFSLDLTCTKLKEVITLLVLINKRKKLMTNVTFCYKTIPQDEGFALWLKYLNLTTSKVSLPCIFHFIIFSSFYISVHFLVMYKHFCLPSKFFPLCQLFYYLHLHYFFNRYLISILVIILCNVFLHWYYCIPPIFISRYHFTNSFTSVHWLALWTLWFMSVFFLCDRERQLWIVYQIRFRFLSLIFLVTLSCLCTFLSLVIYLYNFLKFPVILLPLLA